MKSIPARLIFLLLPLLISFLSCCKTGKMSEPEETDRRERRESRPVSLPDQTLSLLSPKPSDKLLTGDPLKISWKQNLHEILLDSVDLFLDGRLLGRCPVNQGMAEKETSGLRLGRHTLKLTASDSAGASFSASVVFFILSDLVPQKLTYRIIHTYPHDPEAYTQGLIYDDGFLYESTGQYGRSSLRKIKPETGELINSLSLSKDFFGEGITFWEDKIIQLTWTSRVGFIYDRESFTLIRKIHYQTQGWGLTSDGKNLIMSDGSNILYFLEPELFTEVSRIEVFDHLGPVNDLNELEYVDGKIFANVYQTDDIVIIDPGTGKVLSRANLGGILDPKYRHPKLDVLNGIAWDGGQGRLFVTGKMWPLLFEIRLVPVNP